MVHSTKEEKDIEESKIRGFTLDYSAIYEKQLNHETMVQFVTNFINRDDISSDTITLQFPQIKRKKALHDDKGQYIPIVTEQARKDYKVNYDKRKIIKGTYYTVPFGYNISEKDDEFIQFFSADWYAFILLSLF